MQIVLKSSVGIGGKFYRPGDVVEVERKLALDLIYRAKAEEFITAAPVDHIVHGNEIVEYEEPENDEVSEEAEYTIEELKEMATEEGLEYPEDIEAAELLAVLERHLAEKG
jgi:hypothetical protein